MAQSKMTQAKVHAEKNHNCMCVKNDTLTIDYAGIPWLGHRGSHDGEAMIYT